MKTLVSGSWQLVQVGDDEPLPNADWNPLAHNTLLVNATSKPGTTLFQHADRWSAAQRWIVGVESINDLPHTMVARADCVVWSAKLSTRERSFVFSRYDRPPVALAANVPWWTLNPAQGSVRSLRALVH